MQTKWFIVYKATSQVQWKNIKATIFITERKTSEVEKLWRLFLVRGNISRGEAGTSLCNCDIYKIVDYSTNSGVGFCSNKNMKMNAPILFTKICQMTLPVCKQYLEEQVLIQIFWFPWCIFHISSYQST